MARWLRRSVVQAPRNGTTSHTVTFTPADASSLLVLVLEGAVTHTVPTGWTRRAQALLNTELSVYTKTATAGESSFSTTHNGSDFAMAALVYEFSAGATFLDALASTGNGATSSGPNLAGFSSSNLLVGVVGQGPSGTAASVTWTAPVGIVEDVDLSDPVQPGGYLFSAAYVEDSSATSFSPTSTTTGAGAAQERVTFAVQVTLPPAPEKVRNTSALAAMRTGSFRA